MNTWTPLWNGIVDSSIWDEPDHVRIVFVTMLALKDGDHVVRLNAYQLGKRARKDEQQVLDALRILSSPDSRRLENQEYGGRRIKAVEDGWLVLNGEKYRDRVREEMKKARNRKAQRKWRWKNAFTARGRGDEAALRRYLKWCDEWGRSSADDHFEEILAGATAPSTGAKPS